MTADMSVVAATEVDAVRRVLSPGARKVAVLDMVELGLTPKGPRLTPDGTAVTGAMSKVHNLALYDALSTSGLLDDQRVDLVQISRPCDAIADRPADFGFSVVDGDPCPGWDRCDPATWPTPDADRTREGRQGPPHQDGHVPGRRSVSRRQRRARGSPFG